jgi:hypothetical protein
MMFAAPGALAQGSTTWRPPVGIPMPTFGIVEDVRMYLEPAQTFDYADDSAGAVAYRVANGLPYTHYVDNTHAGATDSDNPHGSPERPRLTWPYPLPAGSAVQIHGGPYDFDNARSNSLAFGGDGTAERPIFFYSTADRPADGPRIARSAYNWGNYTIVERLRFVNDASFGTRPLLKGAPVIKPVYRHLYMSGTGGEGNPSAITSGGSSGASAADGTEGLVAWDNEIFGYGDVDAADENDGCSFILSQFCVNAWVVDNVTYHMGGDSIRIGADQGDEPSGSHYYIGRNVFHHNRENAIDVKQAHHAVISENVMYGFTPSSSDSGTAVAIHYEPSNIWILNNEIYEATRGIVSTGLSDTLYIIGNRIHDVSEYAMYPARGGGNVRIFNNTIWASGNGIVTSGVIDSLEIRNNIVYDVAGAALQVDDSAVRERSTVSHELYYASSGAVSIDWGGEYASVADWVAGEGIGEGSLEADPMIADAAQHLSDGSPALAIGYDWTALDDTFAASFGVTMLRDFDGDPRNVPIDLGADQHTGAPPRPLTDAGPAPDGGGVGSDGGTRADGGARDGGTTGPGATPADGGGCGCSPSGSPSALALFALAAVLLSSFRRGCRQPLPPSE